MNEMMKTYLKQAGEIIGERTAAEFEYDNTVIASLATGADIQTAIAAANKKYPAEALKPMPNQWIDLAARYEYILEHEKVLTRLGIR